jgi:hypothetical protein
MLTERGTVPKRVFDWICGQLPNGREWKWQEKTDMSGDRGWEWSEGKTEFWAVATPL